MIALRAAGADGLPPSPARSLSFESGLDPLHGLLLLHQHHVETARRRRRQAQQGMLRRKNDGPLFGRADAASGPATGAVAGVARSQEHQGAVPLAQHQVDLAAAAPGRPIIARHQLQTGGLQMGQGQVLGGMAALAGGGRAGGGWWGGGGGGGVGGLLPVVSFQGIREISLSASFASARGAAHDAAAAQHYPQGALYMVATPIGNLADITLRALHLLQLADTVACEDKRHTQAMLRAYGIDKSAAQLLALHQHNEAEAAQQLVLRLQQGQRVAYVSDAGTPGVSDPGARLVAAVQAAGLRAVPLPGASSLTAALSVAGAVAQGSGQGGFVFVGFLPVKNAERAGVIAQQLAREPRCVLLLEAPHRIGGLARALAVLGGGPLNPARELTKQFEEVATLPAQALTAWLAGARERERGEFVLLLHPMPVARDDGESLRVLRLLLQDLPLKTAVRLAAQITGAARNVLYEMALACQRDGEPAC